MVIFMSDAPALAVAANDQMAPASPIPRQRIVTTSPGTGKLRVFISYSRADLDFADQLDAALDLTGFDSTMDRQGIQGGEEWQSRLGNLIRDSDTIIFVLSPASAASKVCGWEVDEAARQGKRIIPVCCHPLEDQNPPERLQKLNYIFFYPEPKSPGSGFGTGLAKLVTALNTDLDWLREHTRILQRASEWEAGGKPANRLLSGADITAAKTWAARRPKDAPEPTPLHLDFIRASEHEDEARLNSERQQLAEMAAAQTERAKALTAAEEALKQAAEAQRRRAVIRNTAMAAVTAIAVIAAWFWQEAEKGRTNISYLLDNSRKLVTMISERYSFKDDEYALALELFERGSELGDPSAMFMLGAAYENGLKGKEDLPKALELYQKAADKNYPQAIYTIATRYETGNGLPLDESKARELFEKAAELSDANTVYALAQRYEEGVGVELNTTRARDLYERAARRDHVDAMRWLAKSFLDGVGVVKDAGKGREWLEKAAAKGTISAMLELAELYETGSVLLKSDREVLNWLKKAAEKDDTTALRKLAMKYENGIGVEADEAAAQDYFQRVVAKEGASSMTDIGTMYENGQGVPKSYVKARKWYDEAAKSHDTRGSNYLAAIVLRGKDGTAPDAAQAIALYEKSAALGDSTAMSNLGLIYHNGDGVPVDGARALTWHKRAAELGDTYAMVNAGLVHEYGVGVEKNAKEARAWFDKATENGNTEAYAWIGTLYETAFGSTPDYDEARKWYQKAADAGSTFGTHSLAVLAYFGYGEPQDFAKARSQWESVADKDDLNAIHALAVIHRFGQGVEVDIEKSKQLLERGVEKDHSGSHASLGSLYAEGTGVPRDFAKARALYKKSGQFGNHRASWNLEQLDIDEIEAAGNYSEALRRQQALTPKTEASEIKDIGKAGDQTAVDLDREGRFAIQAREFGLAYINAKTAVERLPDEFAPHVQLAHALMFIGKADEARALHIGRKGKQVAGRSYMGWELAVKEDFERFRAAGVTHPLMEEIERELSLAK